MAQRNNARNPQSSKGTSRSNFPNILVGVVAIILLFFGLKQCNTNDRDENTASSSTQGETFSPIKGVRVFIENSGSMDGYVQPVNSQLKSDLNALVSNIDCENIRLHYINSQIIPIRVKRTSDFFENLSVTSFQKNGGNRSSTSLQDLLNRVYEATKPGEVSILVSDMILALNSGQSPESVSTNIETDLRRQLKTYPNWSVVAWRMLSDYQGKYYHSGSPSVQLSGVKRPYYIFFLGDREQLRSILAEGRLPANLPLLKNRTHTLSLEPNYAQPNYHIAPKATLGEIELDRSDRLSRSISSAKRGSLPNGQQGVGFEVVLKPMPKVLLNEGDLLEKAHYEVEPKDLRVVRVQKQQGGGLNIRLETSNLSRGNIQVRYKQPIPSWFDEVHSEQNSNIKAGKAIEKTYGIRYILEGLYRPYETQAPYLFTLPIQIN